MDDYSELIDSFINEFNEITENKTKKTHIKISVIKHLLDDARKKCISNCNDKIQSLTKNKPTNPTQNFIKTQFANVEKDDKERLEFNGLNGYKKFARNIKHLITNDEIDINDDNFDINEILEDLSKLIIEEVEEVVKEKPVKSTKSKKSVKKNVKSNNNSDIDSDSDSNNNCKTEYFSDSDNNENSNEEDIPKPKVGKKSKKKNKNKDPN